VQKQANCYWCTSDIVADSVYQVKTYWYCTIIDIMGKSFWNKGDYGFPICDKCLGSFKYGRLKTITIEKKGLDKWLSSA